MVMNISIRTIVFISAISTQCLEQQPPPRLVVISFDAFRPDYMNTTITPNLMKIAVNGVQGKMRSTFVTKTMPNHQSIATGLYEPWHGVVNNYFIDPMNLTKLPFSTDTGASIFYWDMFNHTVPIYIANQLANIDDDNGNSCRFSGSMQWPGSISSYTDGQNNDRRYRIHYQRTFHPKYDWQSNIETVVKWMNDVDQPANLIMMYFDQPDRKAHEFGPFSMEVREQIKHIDLIVGHFLDLLDQTNLTSETNLIILSDHGMSDITMNRVIYLEKCQHLYPGLDFELIGRSPVFSVIPLSKPNNSDNDDIELINSVQQALRNCSQKLFGNHFQIYQQNEIPERYHYRGNRRILSLFMIADEGYELVDMNAANDWQPRNHSWGDHGFDNYLESMRPLFIADGPAFRHGYIHPIEFENIDLYPLMLTILNIPSERFLNHNGTYSNVKQMLNDDEKL